MPIINQQALILLSWNCRSLFWRQLCVTINNEIINNKMKCVFLLACLNVNLSDDLTFPQNTSIRSNRLFIRHQREITWIVFIYFHCSRFFCASVKCFWWISRVIKLWSCFVMLLSVDVFNETRKQLSASRFKYFFFSFYFDYQRHVFAMFNSMTSPERQFFSSSIILKQKSCVSRFLLIKGRV